MRDMQEISNDCKKSLLQKTTARNNERTKVMSKNLFATNKLKEIRFELGYSQKEASAAISLILGKKVSYSLYQKIEQGRKPVSMKDAITIAREWEASIQDLWRSGLLVKRDGRVIE